MSGRPEIRVAGLQTEFPMARLWACDQPRLLRAGQEVRPLHEGFPGALRDRVQLRRHVQRPP